MAAICSLSLRRLATISRTIGPQSQGAIKQWAPGAAAPTCVSWTDDSGAWETVGIALGGFGANDNGSANVVCETYHLSAFTVAEIDPPSPDWTTVDLMGGIGVLKQVRTSALVAQGLASMAGRIATLVRAQSHCTSLAPSTREGVFTFAVFFRELAVSGKRCLLAIVHVKSPHRIRFRARAVRRVIGRKGAGSALFFSFIAELQRAKASQGVYEKLAKISIFACARFGLWCTSNPVKIIYGGVTRTSFLKRVFFLSHGLAHLKMSFECPVSNTIRQDH